MNNKCEICFVNAHKYKCPGCEMKTCSLPCYSKHKQDKDCNGQRKRTKFVSKDEFSEIDLLNDYRFLEEQSLLVDSSQRNLNTQDALVNKGCSGFYENLRKFLHNEFNINLKIMPAQSTRHLNNKTKFTRITRMVSWPLEFIFHENDSKNSIKIHTKNVLFSSQEPLRNVLFTFYDKYKEELFNSCSVKCTLVEKNPMSLYASFGSFFENRNFDGLYVLFRIDDLEKKQKYFMKFNLDENLEILLRDKTIIEYPTLYVVKKDNLKDFLIKTEEKDEKDILKYCEKSNEKSSNIKSLEELEDGECNSDDDFKQTLDLNKRLNSADQNKNKKFKE